MNYTLLYGSIALVLTIVLIVVLSIRKDGFVYDPLYGSTPPSLDNKPDYKSFFEAVHANPTDSIETARYEKACENCKKPLAGYEDHPMTPRSCEQCRSFVKGHQLVFRGMGIL